MRLFKSQEEKQEIAEARSDFDDFVKAATSAEPEQARKLAVQFRATRDSPPSRKRSVSGMPTKRSVPMPRTCSRTII
jgi:hypothetical protein